jgi:hypothetical protein
MTPPLRNTEFIIDFLQEFIKMHPNTGVNESRKANVTHAEGYTNGFVFTSMRMRDKTSIYYCGKIDFWILSASSMLLPSRRYFLRLINRSPFLAF